MNYTPKRVSETEPFSVNYGLLDHLAVGETILSAVWSMRIVRGIDPNPSAMLVGGATIDGLIVTQQITGGVAGVTYEPICTAVTSAGNIVVLPEKLTGYLPVVV